MEGPTGGIDSLSTGDIQTGLIGVDIGVLGHTGYTGPTGPSESTMAMFPSAATGPIEPPHIATIEELMSSYGAIVNKEATDKKTLSLLLNENRDALRVPLFQWAAAGFPGIWVVQSFTIDPPSICSDGVSRELIDYFEYSLGKPLNDAVADIQSKLTGIKLSMSFEGNTLRLHVTKDSV